MSEMISFEEYVREKVEAIRKKIGYALDELYDLQLEANRKSVKRTSDDFKFACAFCGEVFQDWKDAEKCFDSHVETQREVKK